MAVFVVLAGLLAVGSRAEASSTRGHVFGYSFAEAGGGAGQVVEPGGVAVDEVTGDVYVVDAGNRRVDRFSGSGQFIAAWGWGVKDGADEFEVCERECRAGLSGAGRGELDEPGAIAIDNSTDSGDPSRGDVYVVADSRAEHGRVWKFSSEGSFLESIKQAGSEPRWEGALDGLAVDGAGGLWVYRGIEREGVVERFSDALKSHFEEPVLESPVFCPKPGFAVDATGEHVYLDHERENREELCPVEEGEAPRAVVAAQLGVEGEVLKGEIGALDPLQTTAIATEASSGDVYLAGGDLIRRLALGGVLIERLSLPGTGPDAGGLAVNATAGLFYVTDAASGKVDVFEPERAGRPSVSGLAAQDLTPSTAKLSALVDPTGADTHYFFQYGTASCEASPDTCIDAPAPPGLDAGSGFGDVNVSVELQGLAPSSTYYYRLVAANAFGEAEGSETFGSVTTLPSAEGVLPDGRAWELVSPFEKDGSGIEPLRREGGVIQSSEDGDAIAYVANGPIVSEPEGNRAPYPTQALATRSVAGWSSQQIVTPHSKGEGYVPGEAPEYRMFSGSLATALVEPDNHHDIEPFEAPPLAPEATEKTMYLRNDLTPAYLPLVTAADDTAGTRFGEQLEFVDATPDLSHVVFESKVPLISAGGPGLYEWRAGLALQQVSILPDGQAALEPRLGQESHNVRGAISSDGSRVIWSGESEVTHGETVETVRHLYMRDTVTGQTLQLDAAAAGIQEPGEEEAEVGFQGASSDGSTVIFTDTARLTADSSLSPLPGIAGNPADLYMCEIVEEHGELACELSDLTAEAGPLESADVLNVAPAVSEDGSYVYFVANGVLSPGASPGDCVRSEEEPAPVNASCNLYVWHDGAISFIATLSNEDSGDWGSTEGVGARGLSVEPRPDLASVTAGASLNGNFFAFMSNRPLTGYDNIDASPAAKGARDEEVYLYDAATKLLRCASCNPSGQQPHGVLDTQDAGEGLGLLVDRAEDWAATSPESQSPTAHWLAGSLPGWTPLGIESAAQALRAPRYLSDSGRLFFDSADALVAVEHAQTRQENIDGQPTQVGVESVYEYEPAGEGSCQSSQGCVSLISSGTSQQESAFVDASTNGDDAFFVTAQPLVAQDRDTNFDLYDARVCTALSPCLTSEGAASTPCEDTASCRVAEAPAPAVSSQGTSAYKGLGNTPREENRVPKPGAPKPKTLTPTQKLAKALKACRTRWKHSRRKRAICERDAHKAYPAKSSKKTAAKSRARRK